MTMKSIPLCSGVPRLLLGVLFLCLTPNLVAAEFEIETLDGKPLRGAIEAWNGNFLTVAAADAMHRVPSRDLVAVRNVASDTGPPAAEAAALQVQLVDGSVVPATAFAAAEGRADVSLEDAAKPRDAAAVKISADHIQSARLMPLNETQQGQWAEILRLTPDGDLIVVEKDGALDFLSGVLGDVTQERVHFTIDGEAIPVRRAKVPGLVYFHARPPKLAVFACSVRGPGAMRLRAASIEVNDNVAQVTTLCGATIPLPLDSLQSADFSQYLTDIEPESIRYTPYIAVPAGADAAAADGLPRVDRSQTGAPLALASPDGRGVWRDQTYRKGVSLRSRTEIVYPLRGEYRRLTALVGIDPAVRPGGNVRLFVAGDEEVLVDRVITGGERPIPLDVKLDGVRRLRILVDYGEDLDVADYVNLCNPRIFQ